MIGRDIRAMAAEAGIPILTTEIEQRVAFAESMTLGKTIFEWNPGGPAGREIERLTLELLNHVQEELRSSTQAETAHG